MVVYYNDKKCEESMKVGSLVSYREACTGLDMWFGLILDINWVSDQALVYWSGSATHYEYLDELEVISESR